MKIKLSILIIALAFAAQIKSQQPYVGEIRLFAGNFAPVGWEFCQGQMLPIAEYETLFSLIGTTYGGDGQTTFALPDFRGRAPVSVSYAGVIGVLGGTETVTLTTGQIPVHNHPMLATDATGTTSAPSSGMLPAKAADMQFPGGTKQIMTYAKDYAGGKIAVNPQSVLPQGGSQPHDNMKPYVGINYIISLYGIYPQQN
ncbi:MAG: phage tail protein [Bacteroidetes bacterium]|nr:phage tail protein [Bacteroidota bacterium]